MLKLFVALAALVIILPLSAQKARNETVEQGRKEFEKSCGFCHGPDATGARAPDLIRSTVVSHDRSGEDTAGILTTAGKLLFTADNEGNLLALDPATGKTLWHSYGGGRMASSPSTYELDGRQYLLTGVDGILYAWSLPEL